MAGDVRRRGAHAHASRRRFGALEAVDRVVEQHDGAALGVVGHDGPHLVHAGVQSPRVLAKPVGERRPPRRRRLEVAVAAVVRRHAHGVVAIRHGEPPVAAKVGGEKPPARRTASSARETRAGPRPPPSVRRRSGGPGGGRVVLVVLLRRSIVLGSSSSSSSSPTSVVEVLVIIRRLGLAGVGVAGGGDVALIIASRNVSMMRIERPGPRDGGAVGDGDHARAHDVFVRRDAAEEPVIYRRLRSPHRLDVASPQGFVER
mmetsp:Transcript_4333/g.17555  ORF Transcript_4333/g.17555 Transcript_4333/m.17555 type:complete len:259 (-) Transcript_4333:580-1356(-)